MIEITDLNLTYPDGTAAVRDFNLNVNIGESIAVVGANGAGKSTLLMSLVGVMPQSGGSIKIDGITLDKKTLDQIRARVGMVAQNPDDMLFMPTVYEDLAFGPRNYGVSEDEVKIRVDEVLSTLNAEHLRNKMSHKLSGGEKRTAALGSILTMRPNILLLDEPTAFLDPKARRNMIHLLKKLLVTKLIATHDLDMVLDLCERCVVMKNGTLFADGKSTDILTDEKLLDECGLELPLGIIGRYKN